jgi:NodT family efflux transporter outer membrane factor (OMF) lipoprotein
MKATILAWIACGALSACAVPPASHGSLPQTVAQTAPAAWSAARSGEGASDPDIWWSQFDDATLRRLIAQVLQQNLDLQAALERVVQAQALLKVQHAALLPEVDFGASASNTRENLPPPVGEVRQTGARLDANWSPDVFGGERLQVLAARAKVDGSRQALDALRLALAANTAQAYIDLRWAQAELGILQDNTRIRGDALRLTQRRRQFGLSNDLDVARAQNQLSEVQARVPGVQTLIERQLSLLAVYTGRTPESLDPAILGQGPIPVPAGALPHILPSSALLRRPDVSQAYSEVELRAAQVGAARAQRYPQFSLSLSDGVLAAAYLGLPTLTDNVFNLALGATSPIFNAGRIDAQIAGSESRMRESELHLNETLLLALKEIEDSRSEVVDSAAQLTQRNAALSASDRALHLSNELYRGGAASFLDVLDAQESYLRDADAVNQAQRERAQAAVALYRALGGGWRIAGPTQALADAR